MVSNVNCSCAILPLSDIQFTCMTENSNRGKAKTMQSTLRDYWSIWKQFVLHGVTQEDMLPPALMQSWRRCVELGLDPYSEIVSEESTHPTSTSVSHKLLSLVRPAMEDLYQFIEGSECVVVFADAEARIIDTVGDRVMRGELEHLGLNTGAS